MKALEVIQADEALIQLKRDVAFDREYYLALPTTDDVDAVSPAKQYLVRFIDAYHMDRMSPAAWRVLHVYLEQGR